MWILLKNKLPTMASPPKLSIFWSVPWAWEDKEEILKQKAEYYSDFDDVVRDTKEKMGEKYKNISVCHYGLLKRKIKESAVRETILLEELIDNLPSIPEDIVVNNRGFMSGCFDHNLGTARKIYFRGENIRVFQNEFSPVSHENMATYISSGDYELVTDDKPQEHIAEMEKLYSFEIYEAALLDGCEPWQAKLVAQGIDITIESFDFPPLGWYRPSRAILDYFCRTEHEKTITDVREQAI